MVLRSISGLIVVALAGLVTACSSLPPIDASWTYVPSRERAPPAVPPRDVTAVGVVPSQSKFAAKGKAGNANDKKIAELEADIRRLSAEVDAFQSQRRRDPPGMLFSLHNPSEKPRTINCVYLAFRDLDPKEPLPNKCAGTNLMPQSTKANNETPRPDPTKYVSLGSRLLLHPGNTISFPILHSDCPIPTHLLLIDERKHIPKNVGGESSPKDLAEWRKAWTRKGQTVLVHGEVSNGYIRDVYIRKQGIDDGLKC